MNWNMNCMLYILYMTWKHKHVVNMIVVWL